MDSFVASPRDKKRYDVFLSFRGKDTRRGIVSHLHSALVGRVDDTFKDDETIEIGDTISEEIKEAIRNSKFAIVVISKDYVSSTWCLNELQMIMDLHKKKQLLVLPIFYDVVPSDVKHQRGTFSLRRYQPSMERTMAAHVRKWRKALTRVGGVSGKDSRACKDEATMVDDIVEHIARELTSMQPLEMGDIVGMDAHMEQIEPLLDMDSATNDVRMIGIWGMGGIGKTTIAKIAGRNGLPGLQRELLSNILGKKQANISDKEKGCNLIKSKLKKLKVLLVLDDVDNEEQLLALAKDTSWFGPGSRIIITTRDLGLLHFCRLRIVHHVNFLGHDDSIRVFKQVAFDGGRPPSDVYEQLSIRASKLAQGLPSALDAFGTYLRQKISTEAWERALDILEKFPPQSIMEIVRTSYEGLDKRDQAVFLHLACLFNGDNFHRVATLFDHGDERIKDLRKKSLIDISPDGCITMHVLVEQAGREIVLQESKSKLWRRRILWEPEEIVSVLQNTTGIALATTEGVSLHMCDMPRMVSIDGGILNAINNLEYFKAFTHLNNIESTLNFNQGLGQLKRLDVTGSKNLIEIPDLSRATELEALIMKGCRRLEKIPENDSPSRIQTQATPANHIDASQSSKAINFSCKPIHRGENTHRVNASQG
ncbi:BnaC06g23980D [Brassica napus]|uniref:BnaC06g23980D protein n=1 Tax=Brassica napus TaxID=3708 RepID=A0A078FCT3_BRANA|nr:BnaC06g23980D [Brassica napus]